MPGEMDLHNSSLAAEIPEKLGHYLSMCSHDNSQGWVRGAVGVLWPAIPG